MTLGRIVAAIPRFVLETLHERRTAVTRDGRVVWDLNGITKNDWDKLGKYGPQVDK